MHLLRPFFANELVNDFTSEDHIPFLVIRLPLTSFFTGVLYSFLASSMDFCWSFFWPNCFWGRFMEPWFFRLSIMSFLRLRKDVWSPVPEYVCWVWSRSSDRFDLIKSWVRDGRLVLLRPLSERLREVDLDLRVCSELSHSILCKRTVRFLGA